MQNYSVTDFSMTPQIYTTSGSLSTPADTHSTASSSTIIPAIVPASGTHSSLAPEPSVDSSKYVSWFA